MCWLCWWYVASFAMFDGFRQYNASIKATYTVGDILSRQMLDVDENFLDGLSGLYEYLIKFGSEAELRYTSLKWVDRDERYEVHWSYPTGSRAQLTTADLSQCSTSYPIWSMASTSCWWRAGRPTTRSSESASGKGLNSTITW